MKVEEVKQLCKGFAGATEELLGVPSNVLFYQIGGKKFAYFKTSEPETWRFSVRVSPDRFLELTDQPGIKPARYMHRFHWITIVKPESVEEEYLKELVLWSYNKAFSSLPARIKKELSST